MTKKRSQGKKGKDTTLI